MKAPSLRSRWILVPGLVLVVTAALLPWWRNRAYLRHFFDYGLVIAGVTRIEEGERPYVDFTTPNQSGAFLFDLAAEKLGGGTYRAMTLGAGVFIAASAILLAGMLARRWPPIPSLAVAGAVVCAGVSQHTIIWYNSVGVVCLAVVAWCGAAAPVLRRADAGWHGLLALALLMGGVTKLNFQVLALAVAAGWALRAGWRRDASWGRVTATVAFVAVWGAVLPVAAEMMWTGASLPLWWHNAVALGASDRAGDLAAMLKPGFYWRPVHDYYGRLLLPPVGLVGALLTLWATGVALRRRWADTSRHDRWLVPAAGMLAAGGGAALLATNYEIAYVALAAWLALVAGLWLGFGLPPRGAGFWWGLVLPSLVVAAVSWDSAWQGQRSQFGYSTAPRKDYREGSSAGPEFGYWRGTYLPPEDCESLADLARWHAEQASMRCVLYGPGLEWLERVWPVDKVPRLPLAIRWGATCGPREMAALAGALRPGGDLQKVLVSLPEDLWRGESREVLGRWYTRNLMAPQIVRYELAERRPVPGKPLDFWGRFGGNVDSRLLFSWMEPQAGDGGRSFLGVDHGCGALVVRANCLRVTNEAVLRRRGPGPGPAVHAQFWVNALLSDGREQLRWEKSVELPAGQAETVVSCGSVDGSGAPVFFRVAVPASESGEVVAGWRAPTITHVSGESADPPDLRGTSLPPVEADAASLAALLPPGFRPERVVVRGGRLTAAGLELPAGGEVWVRPADPLAEFSGEVRRAPGRPSGAQPYVVAIWYKAGRMEVQSNGPVPGGDGAMRFRAWSAEPNGWFGLLMGGDPDKGAPVVVRVTTAKTAN